LWFLLLMLCGCSTQESSHDTQFTFIVAADMRKFTGDNPEYFRGACEDIQTTGRGSFMISPGDIDPPDKTLETIQNYIVSSYIWYTVIGNHEAETPSDMKWLRNYNLNGDTLPNIVTIGPNNSEETTYAFEFQNVHFVVLNQYYNGKTDTGSDGDIVDELYEWLYNDLANNQKPIIFVFGHEPAFPQPDSENGRLRHAYDSLNSHPNTRDRFWDLLFEFRITAYICGHTHNYSAVKIDGVWQIDVGHARGIGDKGSRSTYIRFEVNGKGDVNFTTYRLDFNTRNYEIFESVSLN